MGAAQVRAGRWLLLHLFSRHLLPGPSPQAEALFLRSVVALLLLVALVEAVLLVLAAQTLLLSSGATRLR